MYNNSLALKQDLLKKMYVYQEGKKKSGVGKSKKTYNNWLTKDTYGKYTEENKR